MTGRGMSQRHWPLIGIVLAVCLFFVAASFYPGGTTDAANTVGYEWAHNFISSLFAPHALNGAANPARLVAIPAMLLLCVSMAVLFKSISNKGTSAMHKQAIAIGGIGSMVYAFLVVTPMHNLMVNISLAFGLVALVATLHLLYVARHSWLFVAGSVNLALLLVTAAMYYGHMRFDLLPIVQKVSLVACVVWLMAVHYTIFDPGSRTDVAPSTTMESR